MEGTSPEILLVIDIRADRIGYAVFDRPDHLIDYGTSRFRAGKAARARVEFLLMVFDPSVLVMRRLRVRSTRKGRTWTMHHAAIVGEAKRQKVPVAYVAERTLRNSFAEFHCRNKFQVATLLGTWFPELAAKVPRQRKCYEPEQWGMALFDAVALGVVYATSVHKSG